LNDNFDGFNTVSSGLVLEIGTRRTRDRAFKFVWFRFFTKRAMLSLISATIVH